MKTLMRILMWVLSILLVVAFSAAGIPKLMGNAGWIRAFTNWGQPRWMLMVVGLLEVLGALALLNARTALYGLGILAVVMLGAAYTHVAAGEGYAVLRPLIFLALACGAAGLRLRA